MQATTRDSLCSPREPDPAEDCVAETTLSDTSHPDSFGAVEGAVEKLAQGQEARLRCTQTMLRAASPFTSATQTKPGWPHSGASASESRVFCVAIPAPACPCPSVTSPTSRYLNRQPQTLLTSGASCPPLATASLKRSSELRGMASDRPRPYWDSCCFISSPNRDATRSELRHDRPGDHRRRASAADVHSQCLTQAATAGKHT